MFGLDENLKIRNKFSFPANNLNITSIDIQSVEPVDQRTRDSLQKSVQLAIEITTNSQEAAARSVLGGATARLLHTQTAAFKKIRSLCCSFFGRLFISSW